MSCNCIFTATTSEAKSQSKNLQSDFKVVRFTPQFKSISLYFHQKNHLKVTFIFEVLLSNFASFTSLYFVYDVLEVFEELHKVTTDFNHGPFRIQNILFAICKLCCYIVIE